MMSQQAAAEFFARDFAAWNNRDLEAAVAVTTEDVLMEGPAPLIPQAGVRGHAAYRSWLESTWGMLPDLRIDLAGPVLTTGDGTQAAAPWRLRGTMAGRLDPPGFAPTHMPVELAGIDVWRFRDGHGCQLRVYTDLNTVARQIGALPPQGSTGERLGVLLQRLAARKMRRQAHSSGYTAPSSPSSTGYDRPANDRRKATEGTVKRADQIWPDLAACRGRAG
jgi:ketosteroid isomerase-like protein